MGRIIITEGVTYLSQALIQSFKEAQIPVTVLIGDSLKKVPKCSWVTYQPINWMNDEDWKMCIRENDSVIFSVHPAMFNSGLWHGKEEDLRKLIASFIQRCHPKKVLEVKLEKTESSSPDFSIYTVPKAYLDSDMMPQTKMASSIQRMTIQPHLTVENIVLSYAEYLKAISLGLITVSGWPHQYHIYLKGLKRPLIAMYPKMVVESEAVQLRLMHHGYLYRPSKKYVASFYFRKITKHQIITCLYQFQASLPWPIYCRSQAVIHEWVMKGFRKWLTLHR